MQILTVNIRHGGGTRVPAILDYVRRSDADVLAITEHRAGGTGVALCEGLGGRGHRVQIPSLAEPRTNGVMFAARVAATPLDVDAGQGERRRIVGCRVAGFSIYAVHFALGEDKAGLYRLIEERSAAWTREPSLLIGDFNTGRHHVDEDGATFHLSDRFEGRQPGLGWTDMWRRFHGDRREASWISPRGNGFRIDHVLASARAVPNVAGVAYDHATRPTLTDRSATIVRYRARG